jgi:hypothetical protein
MIFQQTSAPTGWTKETTATYNDSALRFTTGTVGTGGADAFNTLFGTSKTTAGFTLTTNEMPSHTHTLQLTATTVASGGAFWDGIRGDATAVTNDGFGQVIGSSGSGAAHSHTLNNFNLKFSDCIIATRN